VHVVLSLVFFLIRGETVLRAFLFLSASALVAGCSTYQASPAAPTPAAAPAPPSTAAPAPSPAPTGPPTVTITAAGFSPLEITIDVGQRVTFVNNDNRNHDLIGGADMTRPDCPEIVVFVTPGQRRDTDVFTTARTCEYHDHAQLGVPGFVGRIIVK
jgi:plastocyanin